MNKQNYLFFKCHGLVDFDVLHYYDVSGLEKNKGLGIEVIPLTFCFVERPRRMRRDKILQPDRLIISGCIWAGHSQKEYTRVGSG